MKNISKKKLQEAWAAAGPEGKKVLEELHGFFPPKICPITGEQFIPIRRDQKFSSKKARIRFNNNLAKASRDAKLLIQKALDKNRKILAKIVAEHGDGSTHPIDYLRKMEFDFRYITSVGSPGWYCIYDYGYVIEGTGQKQTIMVTNTRNAMLGMQCSECNYDGH